MVHRSTSQLILDKIIFQNRNQSYGAFAIRQRYNAHLITAIFLAILSFGTAIIVTNLIKNIYTDRILSSPDLLDDGPVITILDPVFEQPAITPPKPAVTLPALASSSPNLPPKIVDDQTAVIENPIDLTTGIAGAETSSTSGTETIPLTILTPPETTPTSSETFEIIVTDKPVFDGDYVKFLQQNIHYPAAAMHNNVSGKVFVEYILKKDGTIDNVKVIRGIGYGCDEEALRVIKLMSGKWTPGKVKDMPVNFKTIATIYFKLPE